MNSISRYPAHAARSFLLALQYFTRVPIPAPLAAWTGFTAPLQRASLGYFPGIGWIVAAVAAACYWAVARALRDASMAPLAAAVIAAMATAMLTGAMHEDGLADTADGLASGDRAQSLAAMKDPHVGAAGLVALVLALVAQVGVVAGIGAAAGWRGAAAALLGGHVLSRGLALAIVATLPNIGSPAASKSLGVASQVSRASLAIAAAWCAAALAGVAFLANAWAAIAGLILSVAAVVAVRQLFQSRLQGFTGDCLGATQQVCQVAFCFGMATILRGGA